MMPCELDASDSVTRNEVECGGRSRDLGNCKPTELRGILWFRERAVTKLLSMSFVAGGGARAGHSGTKVAAAATGQPTDRD